MLMLPASGYTSLSHMLAVCCLPSATQRERTYFRKRCGSIASVKTVLGVENVRKLR